MSGRDLTRGVYFGHMHDPAAPTLAELDAATDITEHVVTLTITPDLTAFDHERMAKAANELGARVEDFTRAMADLSAAGRRAAEVRLVTADDIADALVRIARAIAATEHAAAPRLSRMRTAYRVKTRRRNRR